jgi:hypothetical protein
MVVIFLKSKCFGIKLKCVVGDPDRYWNIGRKRYCALYLTSICGGHITGVRKGGRWRFWCMAVVRRIFVECGGRKSLIFKKRCVSRVMASPYADMVWVVPVLQCKNAYLYSH